MIKFSFSSLKIIGKKRRSLHNHDEEFTNVKFTANWMHKSPKDASFHLFSICILISILIFKMHSTSKSFFLLHSAKNRQKNLFFSLNLKKSFFPLLNPEARTSSIKYKNSQKTFQFSQTQRNWETKRNGMELNESENFIFLLLQKGYVFHFVGCKFYWSVKSKIQ